MAGSLNKAMIIGNLGRDPELRSTANGQSVARLNVATSRNFTDREGNRREETEWHKVVLFSRLAELAERYLRKGSKVYIEGRLQTRSWEDQQSGQRRYMTEIVARDMTFLDAAGGAPSGGGGPSGPPPGGPEDSGGEPGGAPAPEQGPPGGSAPGGSDPGYFDDDDIPF